jgi:hypothetical protein
VLFAAWIWIASWGIQHFTEVGMLSPFYISIGVTLSYFMFSYKENMRLSAEEIKQKNLVWAAIFVVLFVVSFGILSWLGGLWGLHGGHSDHGHGRHTQGSHTQRSHSIHAQNTHWHHRAYGDAAYTVSEGYHKADCQYDRESKDYFSRGCKAWKRHH